MKSLKPTIILLFSALLILSGCKSSKDLGAGIRPDLNKKTTQLVEKINENAFMPKTLSFKATAKVKSGEKSNSFKMSVRMKPDSVIWISITAYSYEAARILATPDSLFFINRMDKKYFAGSYDFINEKLSVDVDFKTLQSILLGNSVGLDEMDKVKRSSDKDYYLLSSYRKAKLKKLREKSYKSDDDELVFSNWISADFFRIIKLGILDLRYNQSAVVEYSSFSDEGGYKVAHKMDATITSNQMAHISAEYYRFEINQEENFPFKISDKYESLD